MTYKNPFKKNLEKLREKASSRMQKTVDELIAQLNDIDPKNVRDKLPIEVKKFFEFTVIRAYSLRNLIRNAHESRCFIEVFILIHGYIQFVLRALFILAWQTAEKRPLTKEEIEPYYKYKSKQGSVIRLVKILKDSEIIDPKQSTLIEKVNELRNNAAHGIIFGEIEISDLAHEVESSIKVFNQTYLRLKGWFNNPVPLKNFQK